MRGEVREEVERRRVRKGEKEVIEGGEIKRGMRGMERRRVERRDRLRGYQALNNEQLPILNRRRHTNSSAQHEPDRAVHRTYCR